VLTLVGILTRPGNIREWAVALAGAAVVLLTGAITPAAAIGTLGREWDVFAFLLGLFGIAAIAEQSGIVDRLTAYARPHAAGRRDRLLVLVSGVAAVVTVTLSNDATVLILTPLVIALCRALAVPVLPYAFACVLMANAASLVLPVANPANVIVLHDAPVRLGPYLAFAALPSIVAIIATVAALLFVFRSELRGGLGDPATTEGDPDALLVAIGIGAIMLAYLAALALGWPVGVVAVGGAVLLLLLRAARGHLEVRRYAGGIEWAVFPFLAGLFVLVAAAEQAGVGPVVAAALTEAEGAGTLGTASLALAAAVASNAMNNLPFALVAGEGLRVSPGAGTPTVVALLVGIDLGPSFTTIGSLATLIWILILRRRDVPLSTLAYMRIAFLPALAALAAAVLALAAVTAVAGR